MDKEEKLPRWKRRQLEKAERRKQAKIKRNAPILERYLEKEGWIKQT